MRTILIAATMAACGADASGGTDGGPDNHTDKPLCQVINDDMTYLNEYPMAPCELYLGYVDYHLFTSPLDPNGEPYPILLDGWERALELPGMPLVKASNAPVVKVREHVYMTSAVLHEGTRGRALVLDERLERCEWVRCR